ncbi:MAG: FmdE family protein, partial [Desulfonatronovibrio sp.]
MISKIKLVMIILISMIVFQGTFASMAACEKNYEGCPKSAKDLPPLTVEHNGEKRVVSLCQAFDFHGNSCPGATMAFMALRYGLELLYDDEVPVMEDLLIISRAPGGPMDLLDLLMKGDNHAARTWPPEGITRGRENFVFQFMRKSTQEGVTIKLRKEMWPDDWFILRDKKKAGTITDQEKNKMKQDRAYVVNQFPGKSFSELFETPEEYRFVAWGHLEPGEMDKNIRKYR